MATYALPLFLSETGQLEPAWTAWNIDQVWDFELNLSRLLRVKCDSAAGLPVDCLLAIQ